MIREAARFAAGWLPQPVRAQLARRRFGYAGGGARFELTRTPRPDGIVELAVSGGPRCLLPHAMEPDFLFHFVENADSRQEMAAFMRLSSAGPADGVLLDVGAHKGLFSIVHLVMGPLHRAVLLEPSRALTEEAGRVMRLNGAAERSEVVTAGAGAENGTRHVTIDDLGFARMSSGSSGEAVPFTTIDSLCRERGIVPSMVKIDVEGAEGDVIRGARATLRAHHPVICLELHLDELERRSESADPIFDDLSALGYRFESTSGDPLPLWRLRRSLMAVVRVVAR